MTRGRPVGDLEETRSEMLTIDPFAIVFTPVIIADFPVFSSYNNC